MMMKFRSSVNELSEIVAVAGVIGLLLFVLWNGLLVNLDDSLSRVPLERALVIGLVVEVVHRWARGSHD